MRIPGDYQFNALTKGFFVQRGWHKNKLDLIGLLKLGDSNKTLIDVGCGSGNLLFLYHGKFKSLLGLDNNIDALDFIRKRVQEEEIPNITVAPGDLNDLSIGQEFDVATCMEVIEHFDLEHLNTGVFSNISALVRPGGKLFITTPNRNSIWPLLERLVDLLRLVPNMSSDQHFSSFTVLELEHLLKNHGFEVENIGSFNHFSPFLPGSFLRGLVLKAEVKYIRKYGPLLYAVAIRKSNKG